MIRHFLTKSSFLSSKLSRLLTTVPPAETQPPIKKQSKQKSAPDQKSAPTQKNQKESNNVTRKAQKVEIKPMQSGDQIDLKGDVTPFLKGVVKQVEDAQKILNHWSQWEPGMAPDEYLMKRSTKTYFFDSPFKYSHTDTSVGVRVRNEDEKLAYEFPSIYPAKRVLPQDQFRWEKLPNFKEEWKRKDSYLTEIMPPYKFENKDLSNISNEINKNNGKITKEMIAGIKSLFPQISTNDYASLALFLSMECQFYDKDFWYDYSKTVLESYLKFPNENLWRMRYAFGKLESGLILPELKHKIFERALEVLKTTNSINEIILIMQAFRGIRKKSFFNSVRSALMERKDDLFDVKEITKKPEVLANLLYYFATTRLKHWSNLEDVNRQEIHEFLIYYEQHILDVIPLVKQADLVKIFEGMNSLKSPAFPNIYHEIEKQIVKHKDKFSSDEIADILYLSGHSADNRLFGSDKTFALLEPIFLANAPKMNHLQISRAAYTFAARKHVSPKLYEYIDKRLMEDTSKMSYDSLQWVAYYLLILEHKNEDLWKSFIQRTINIPKPLPIIYYNPFKLCMFYLLHAKPQWEIDFFNQKLWWAERLKVAGVKENVFFDHEEYQNFLRILSTFKLEQTVFYTFENTFQVHYAYPEMKIGIMLYLDKDMVPGTMRINESRLIPSKVLKLQGWEILDISYTQFIEMGRDNAIKYLKEWLTLASDIQVEKGIILF